MSARASPEAFADSEACPSCGGDSVLRFDSNWCCESEMCLDRSGGFWRFIQSLVTGEYPGPMFATIMQHNTVNPDEPFGIHKRLARIAELDLRRAASPLYRDFLKKFIYRYLWSRWEEDPKDRSVWEAVDDSGIELKDNLKLDPKCDTYAMCYSSKNRKLQKKLDNITSPIRHDIRAAKKAERALPSPEIVTLLLRLIDGLKSRTSSGV